MALKGKSPQETSAINVTPLVDVMLVLLIIFMVITPMLQKGVSVDMAKAVNAEPMKAANKTNAVVLALTRDGKVYLGSSEIPESDVTGKVSARIANKLDKTVYLKSDARAKYGDVTGLVDDIRAAGAENLGLITEKVQRRPGVPAPPVP
ncbi:MAG: ExbD/TolR family protein [Terriglobia bacterium]